MNKGYVPDQIVEKLGDMPPYLAGGEAASARLDRARAALVARNRLIIGVLCGLLGAVLVVKGLTAL